MRLKEVHKDRQFIHPEVCRTTYDFGENESSMGRFFRPYLKPLRLNDVQVNWKSTDLSYLKEENFRKKFAKEVSEAKPLQGSDAILKAHYMDGDVRIQYNNQRDFCENCSTIRDF